MSSKIDPSTIKTARRLFAAVSPVGKDGKRWIDYSSVRYNARESRNAAAKFWPGGWPDLLKRGWRIVHVDLTASAS